MSVGVNSYLMTREAYLGEEEPLGVEGAKKRWKGFVTRWLGWDGRRPDPSASVGMTFYKGVVRGRVGAYTWGV